MKLNLGCGKQKLKDWKNIDIDSKCNAEECYDLRRGIREKENSIDEILLSHVLMYLTSNEVITFLKECYRVLKNRGLIRITEDNAQLKIRNEKQQAQYGSGVLFTRIQMEDMLKEVGFRGIREVDTFEEKRPKPSKDYPLAKSRDAVYYIKGYKSAVPIPTVYLGLDDFGEKVSNMDELWRLHDYFHDFKVNLFAIPNRNLRSSWLNYLKSLKWIQLCLHGYNHVTFEELDKVSLDVLTNIYAKVYKPPRWELSDTMKIKLKKLGYKIVNKFNWEINVPPPNETELHAFGHIYPRNYESRSGNIPTSLCFYYKNIMLLPKETKFEFY